MVAIIGFSGRAGAGKTTAAEHLVAAHQFRRLSFATPLKGMASQLGLTRSEIFGDMKDKPSALLGGRTPRFAMQTLGTEWGRDVMGQDFWVNLAKHKAIELLADDVKVVFDDVRFPNEVKMIRDLGGLVIHIVGGKSSPYIDTHASETQELGRDWLLKNDISSGHMLSIIDAILYEKEAA